MVVRPGYLVKAKLQCRAVGGGAAEVSAGKTRRVGAPVPRFGNVNLAAVMLKPVLRAEAFQFRFGKVRAEHRIDGVARQIKLKRRVLLQFCQRSG